MKKTIQHLGCALSCLFLVVPSTFATNNNTQESPEPTNLKTLESRLDNIESYASNLAYIMNHLDKHVVMLQVVPLSSPQTSFDEVTLYASNAITEALNLEQNNFRYALSHASKYFSDDGFIKLKQFLEREKIIQGSDLKVQKINAVLVGHPYISKAYVNSRTFYSDRVRELYTWEVEVPLFIEATTKTGTTIAQKLIKLEVLRASIEISPDQMLIDNITIKDNKTGI